MEKVITYKARDGNFYEDEKVAKKVSIDHDLIELYGSYEVRRLLNGCSHLTFKLDRIPNVKMFVSDLLNTPKETVDKIYEMKNKILKNMNRPGIVEHLEEEIKEHGEIMYQIESSDISDLLDYIHSLERLTDRYKSELASQIDMLIKTYENGKRINGRKLV